MAEFQGGPGEAVYKGGTQITPRNVTYRTGVLVCTEAVFVVFFSIQPYGGTGVYRAVDRPSRRVSYTTGVFRTEPLLVDFFRDSRTEVYRAADRSHHEGLHIEPEQAYI